MESKLKISDQLALPLDAVTQTFAILAKRGAGKTYTAAVLAEELLAAEQQVLVIDPTGAWWGLRSSADGKSAGFPIVVIGGDHGDLPLDEHAGEILATAIVEHRFSAVLDLSLLRKGASLRLMAAFLEALYRLNRSALHLVVDEADTFAPQRVMGEEARCCGAMEDVVKKGRIRGLGCTLITQRPAVLNKNVLTQCESLFALRMVHPKDIDAIQEWVGVHSSPDEAKIVIASLPSLPIGEAWFWSPGWLQELKRIRIRRRRTFDSSATPKAGEVKCLPKRLAEVDLAALGKQVAAAADQAKANDPKELRKQLTAAQAELKKVQAAPPPAAKEKRVEVQVLSDDKIARLEKLVMSLTAVSSGIIERLAQLRTPTTAGERYTDAGSVGHGGEVGNSGLRRIMIALAQRPGLSARQVGVRAGMSSGSGTFTTYLSRARSSGWIVGDRNRMELTAEGLQALGPYDPLPTGQELLQHWLRDLGDSGAARILQAAAAAYPRSLTKTELGEASGLSSGSGTFTTYLSRLRTLELIEGRGEIRASAELFE